MSSTASPFAVPPSRLGLIPSSNTLATYEVECLLDAVGRELRADTLVARMIEAAVLAIVDQGNEVVLETRIETMNGATLTTFHLRVAPADVGKVIGKHGRHARALRTLLQAAAVTAGRRYALHIVEAQPATPATEGEPAHAQRTQTNPANL